METLRWRYYGLKRIKRLLFPEPSARLLIEITGRWWLIFHGARREYRVYVWKDHRWYAADIALPRKKRIVEADGGIHRYNGPRDIIRDQRLGDRGWSVLRITYEEMRANPKKVRRKVRKFLR